MDVRRGVKGVVFDIRNGEPIYLLLHRVLNWRGWEFPKGGVEEGEDHIEALKREIKEETGLDVDEIVAELPKSEWKAEDGTSYSYRQYLVRADSSQAVVLQREPVVEHDAYRWVKYEEAMELLTWENDKQTLKIAHGIVKKLAEKRGKNGLEGKES